MRKAKMPLGFSYRRWSSPEQIKGDTLRRQTHATKDWCERNGVQLDESLRMEDAGVSAFRGKNLEDPDVHALAGFLAAVKSGRVPRGSYLVCESFDRLSRDHWRKALPPLLEMINAGIHLVQLIPEQVIDEASDEWAVMGLIMTLARGRNESVTKSNRVGSAWAEKQKNAATKVITRRLPGWIVYADGKLTLDPEKAETVRSVFAKAHDGKGVHVIARELNAEKVPVIGRKSIVTKREAERAKQAGETPVARPIVWNETVVYHILTTRSVLGEYQPCKGRGSDRAERGEPIPNYYPPVIDPGLWHAVQSGMGRRRKTDGAMTHIGKGRRGKHINLFAGLLVDARNGGSLTYKHLAARPPSIIPVGAKHGNGTKCTSYPATPLEAAILKKLSEVRVEEINGRNDAGRKVETLSGHKAELENLVALWTAKMNDPNIVDTVAAKLASLNIELKKVASKLADAQRDAASPMSEAWGEFRSLADLIANDGSDELRVKIRAALRRTVESITCLFISGFVKVRIAAVRVQFRGDGDRHRNYIVSYEHGRSNHLVQRPGKWSVRTFAEHGLTGGDLRKRDEAAQLEMLILKHATGDKAAASESPVEEPRRAAKKVTAAKPVKPIARKKPAKLKKV
ncbi:MAG: hypothetical protein C0467_07015 [Planctomycetaceae bacterium]|nr:hypothetical protein [Planctomycetaceae bacterium]